MAKIRLRASARADLVAIDEYSVTQFGGDVAAEYSRGIGAVFTVLRQYPMAGRPVSEYGNSYRCYLHRKHRIFYRVIDDTVLIVRILHHAADAKRALKGLIE